MAVLRVAKAYRPYLPEQDLLLPQNVRDWLPEDHLVHFVSDVVDELDLSANESVYEKEERGQPPYHPRMMTKILLYGYCLGVFSSRQMQEKLLEDVGFRVLAAGNEPDFRTISDFHKLHLSALQGLFDQVLKIALQAGTMKLGRVVLDGSKVKANASKHKAMSYGRMQEEEKRLRGEVKRLPEEAEKADQEEDARYERDRSGDELPAELERRETRLEKIREAKRALEQRAREQAKSKGQPEEEAKPKPKMQYNFTDPESRIMKAEDGFDQHALMNPTFHGPTLLAGGTDGPEGSVLVLLSESLIFVLVAIIYRKRKFPLITDTPHCLRKDASRPQIGIS